MVINLILIFKKDSFKSVCLKIRKKGQRHGVPRSIVDIILYWHFIVSALDAESEYLVQDALQKLMVGRTTIIIAHRLSTIKSADQIAVLKEGKIAEIGTYSDLLSLQNGLFKQLVEKQSFVGT